MVQKQIQVKFTDNLQAQEKKVLQELEKWSMVEESVMRPKTRVRWIKLGYSNTKYFSYVLKDRTQKKSIVELKIVAGIRLTEHQFVKEEIFNFYKGLMRASATILLTISRLEMKRGS